MTTREVVLVTGATGGLGRRIALELARRGVVLLLHGRDADALRDVVEAVRATAPEVRGYVADLADLNQVAALADRVLSTEPRLDVLCNNAAVGSGPPGAGREVSVDGHELRLAVNYLAPHLLSQRLLPLLRAAPAPGVVNVAGVGQSPVDFDDLMMEHRYDGMRAYFRSKLALIMSTFELADTGMVANAVHPASKMDTKMVRTAGLTPECGVDDGYAPVIRLIVDRTALGVSGRFFNQRIDSVAHEQAYDIAARARLMSLTDSLLRLETHDPGRRGVQVLH